MQLPPELLLAIQQALDISDKTSEDPFNVINGAFDAPSVLNGYFPDEASLANLQDIYANLNEREAQLQKEVESLREELKNDQDASRMQLIQDMISDLLGQMSRIREKSTEAEAVVKDITKDIQVLDLAKKNLILSMTTLKRLQMLMNAVSQLEDLVSEKKYAEIAQTLSAVKQLSAFFRAYSSIRRVAQVLTRIQELQGEIKTLIDADFDAFILQDTSKQVKPASVAEACNVVDVLGPDIRIHLVDRYVNLELKEYRRIFRAKDEAGQLDNLSRRFAWFRRLLSNHEIEQGRVFPANWRVEWHLIAKFTEITRDDLAAVLSNAGSALTVKLLLDSLAITAEFESSLSRKWATPFQGIIAAIIASSSHSAKTISSAFEPHMGVFVDAQDKALLDMLAPHRRPGLSKTNPRPSVESNGTSQEEKDEPSTIAAVLPSSTELFYFYGQNLDQCSKMSTGKPLYDLCMLHKKWLKVYAEDILVASLKRPAFSSLPRKSMEAQYDVERLKQAATVLNTADYCHSTALELEVKVHSKVDPEYKEKISFQVECDLFVNVISSAIISTLRELESACEPAFLAMTRTSWTTLSQVSGPSTYTSDLAKAANLVIDVIRPLIEQKKYLRNFFDKASSVILSKFTNSLVRSRPLKEIGAEQLLIDLQTIKSYLLHLPDESLTTTSYVKGVTKTATRLETLLKVIVTPLDPPEGFILNYTLLIADASFSNFQKVLDLKGTPTAEQNHLLDTFLTITSTKAELESTSFLSSLDMDPPTTSQLANASPGSSKVSLPLSGDNVFSGIGSPPLSGPPTGSSSGDPTARDQKREVFSDFRRFVSFGLRRDTTGPS